VNRTRVPGEVDAFATNYPSRADGEAPGADELRAVLVRIGMNMAARTVATGEGFASGAEADMLYMLALEAVEARDVQEKWEAERADAAFGFPPNL
jgi:hypothetical protein